MYKSLYNETIIGNKAIVYHRTNKKEVIDLILKDKFQFGSGAMYGKGFYSTFDLKSQLKDYMVTTYGNVIVKFYVKDLHTFVFFIFEEFVKNQNYNKLKVYFKDKNNWNHRTSKFFRNKFEYDTFEIDENTFFIAQLEYFGINENIYKEYGNELLRFSKYSRGYSSDIASYIYEYITKNKNVNGIIFRGRHDGNVLVCYNANLIVPIAYVVNDGGPVKDSDFIPVKKDYDYLQRTLFSEPDRTSFEPSYDKIKVKNIEDRVIGLISKKERNKLEKLKKTNPKEYFQRIVDIHSKFKNYDEKVFYASKKIYDLLGSDYNYKLKVEKGSKLILKWEDGVLRKSNVELEYVYRIENLVASDITFKSVENITDGKFVNCSFEKCNVNNSNLENCKLIKSKVEDSKVVNCSFERGAIHYCELRNCSLYKVNMKSNEVVECDIIDPYTIFMSEFFNSNIKASDRIYYGFFTKCKIISDSVSDIIVKDSTLEVDLISKSKLDKCVVFKSNEKDESCYIVDTIITNSELYDVSIYPYSKITNSSILLSKLKPSETEIDVGEIENCKIDSRIPINDRVRDIVMENNEFI